LLVWFVSLSFLRCPADGPLLRGNAAGPHLWGDASALSPLQRRTAAGLLPCAQVAIRSSPGRTSSRSRRGRRPPEDRGATLSRREPRLFRRLQTPRSSPRPGRVPPPASAGTPTRGGQSHPGPSTAPLPGFP